MPNKISGYNAAEPLAPIQGSSGNAPVAEKAVASAPAPTPQAASTADQVTFTGPALALQKLGAAVANAPVVNSAKVASIKQSVQNGTYTVNPGRVADKILQYDNELN